MTADGNIFRKVRESTSSIQSEVESARCISKYVLEEKKLSWANVQNLQKWSCLNPIVVCYLTEQ